MNRSLILIALFSISAYSAEFEYQGKKIASTINKRLTNCSGYSVSVVLDEFPWEDEIQESIPNGLTIQHNETRRYVSSEVYVSINIQRQRIPSIASILKYKPALIKLFPRYHSGGAQYIATSPAECTAEGFTLGYWIGGNGRGADYVLQFKVSGNEISIPGVLTAAELSSIK